MDNSSTNKTQFNGAFRDSSSLFCTASLSLSLSLCVHVLSLPYLAMPYLAFTIFFTIRLLVKYNILLIINYNQTFDFTNILYSCLNQSTEKEIASYIIIYGGFVVVVFAVVTAIQRSRNSKYTIQNLEFRICIFSD